MEISDSECQESCTITFEWTLRGLKSLFDSTKGESKSKVTKSARFGGGKWQILFYANAGTSKDVSPEGGYVSLYLSCEPTTEEKESALGNSGRWVRDGVYKFSFELRNVGKSVLYNMKEAHNHSFSYKTANWGWAQFARRDNVYYQSTPVKAQDAFVILCSISSSPVTPPPPPSMPRQLVPKALLENVGMLLDDPLYSDVQFIIPRRNQSLDRARRIWASRRLLHRAEYFEEMFSSSFAEGSSQGISLTPRMMNRSLSRASDVGLGSIMAEFEDSDDEDDEMLDVSPSISGRDIAQSSEAVEALSTLLAAESNQDDTVMHDDQEQQTSDSAPLSPQLENNDYEYVLNSAHGQQDVNPLVDSHRRRNDRQDQVSAPGKMTVVVRDVAYNTYRAILYYIYTDNVVFAPLSSSFISTRTRNQGTPAPSAPSTPSELQGQVSGLKRILPPDSATSRVEWIREWMNNNPGRPAPCSAKAVYRVADRLDLRELRDRASHHIFKSLTVDNIAYEVFSPFAAAFDDIRKVEVDFFLTNWAEIRASESMKNVWQQIRNGRHPGFEEVWPLIAQSLEFKPAIMSSSYPTKNGDTAREG